MGCQKAKWMLCIIGEVPVINIFSQNVPESSSITTEVKNIILKAYSTQKVGSGSNFESRNQVYAVSYIFIFNNQTFCARIMLFMSSNDGQVLIRKPGLCQVSPLEIEGAFPRG